MKICGLITEYNPFHNGHIHHMKEAREVTGADALIVIMSGNFVQRGAPAIIDQYERTIMALDGGADLVLQLPAPFSTATAEVFARSAVNLLHQLGCVDAMCFGSETGRIDEMAEVAKVLNHEPRKFQQNLREYIRTGVNYPTARAMALEVYFEGSIENLEELLDKPNNILGIEYLRALETLRSDIKPYAIHRWKTDYHSEQLYEDVASATALRKMLTEEDSIAKITPYVTPFTAREFALKSGICTPVELNDFSLLLQYRLMTEKDRLEEYFDFAPELKERVKNNLPDINTFEEWIDVLNTRTFTYTRIARALLHLLLNIKESDMAEFAEEDYCLYARMLGFRASARELLTKIKDNSALPMISKMANAYRILSAKGLKLLQMDVAASDIYRAAVYAKFGTLLKDDYTAGIVKMK